MPKNIATVAILQRSSSRFGERSLYNIIATITDRRNNLLCWQCCWFQHKVWSGFVCLVGHFLSHTGQPFVGLLSYKMHYNTIYLCLHIISLQILSFISGTFNIPRVLHFFFFLRRGFRTRWTYENKNVRHYLNWRREVCQHIEAAKIL